MDDAAVMDIGSETTDSTTETTEATDLGAESVTETPEITDSKPPDQTEPPPQGPYRPISEDGKRLDDKAKATLEEIKAKDPALARALRDALFDADRFRRGLPGGLREVQELRQSIEELAGSDGLPGLKAELSRFRDFDRQYMAGDPKALEFMLSSPESQQAFLKIAPQAFGKYEELNPEGFASFVCQRIIGDAISADVPVAMKLVSHYLQAGDAAKAAEEFNKVAQWLQGIDATARKQPETPKGTEKPGEDPKFREIERERDNLVRETWLKDSAEEHNRIYRTTLEKLSAGRALTEAQKTAIFHEVNTNLTNRQKDAQSTADRYFAVRDKDGYLKFTKSFGDKNIPDLLQRAFNRYVGTKPGPKPVVNGTQSKPAVNGVAKPEAGFLRVQAAPNSSNIDWSNTFNSKSMILQGKAILLDGKKVQWK